MRFSTVVCAALGLMVLAPLPVRSQGAPIETGHIHHDYTDAPPASLTALLERSTIVVEATIVASRPASLIFGSGADRVESTLTAFELGQIDWIKAPVGGIPTGPVELILAGGIRHVGSRTVRIVDPAFPLPKPGERLLLFLTPGMGGYVPAAHGPESAFVVLGGQVRAVGQSELSRQLAGAGRAALLAELRKRVR